MIVPPLCTRWFYWETSLAVIMAVTTHLSVAVSTVTASTHRPSLKYLQLTVRLAPLYVLNIKKEKSGCHLSVPHSRQTDHRWGNIPANTSRYILVWCRASVGDVGSTLNQNWVTQRIVFAVDVLLFDINIPFNFLQINRAKKYQWPASKNTNYWYKLLFTFTMFDNFNRPSSYYNLCRNNKSWLRCFWLQMQSNELYLVRVGLDTFYIHSTIPSTIIYHPL